MHTSPHTAGLCARVGGSRPYAYPPPHEAIGATYPIVNGVRFISVNPSHLLKVAFPLGSALPPSPALVIVGCFFLNQFHSKSLPKSRRRYGGSVGESSRGEVGNGDQAVVATRRAHHLRQTAANAGGFRSVVSPSSPRSARTSSSSTLATSRLAPPQRQECARCDV
jgi:hypothetical protein